MTLAISFIIMKKYYITLSESKLIDKIIFNNKIWFSISDNNFLSIHISPEENTITYTVIKMLLQPILKGYILETKENGFILDKSISFNFVGDIHGNRTWSFYKHSSINKPISKFKAFFIKLILK